MSDEFDERPPGPPNWPDRDRPERTGERTAERTERRDLPSPDTEAGEPTTSLGSSTPPDADAADGDAELGPWDPQQHEDRRRPTTAEQAVPWLIGLLLALTGIMVVLLALIFVGPEGVAVDPTPTPTPSASSGPSPSATALPTTTPSPTPAPTTTPPPTYGPLEMVYLARSTASSPIRLSRRDFSTTVDPTVVLEDAAGVDDYTWAPDGRVGAAIIDGRAVALVEGQEPRTLIDPVDALAFADDSSKLFGLRIVRDGASDRADVLAIDFTTGATEVLTSISYPHPEIFADPPLEEAQFADNGGIVRLWATVDGYVVAWILGAPSTYRIDPDDGTYIEASRQPILWSPDQQTRIVVAESAGASTITHRDRADAVQATIRVTGLVSHIRWAGTNNEIVFTLGRRVGGGVRQDLYIWDLVDGKAPSPLTSNGASFGAEWMGVPQSWLP